MMDRSNVLTFKCHILTVFLHRLAAPIAVSSPGTESITSGSRYGEELVMRRMWYRDSYGRWHEDRHAEGRSGMPAKWALITLMIFVGFVVIASMIH